jgi:isoamylase
VALRRRHPTFRRRQFFQGRAVHGDTDATDLAWYHPDGHEMTDDAWGSNEVRALTVYLGGRFFEQGARGETVTDTDVLWMINAEVDTHTFVLPMGQTDRQWVCVVDTTAGTVRTDTPVSDRDVATLPDGVLVGESIELIGRSTVVLMAVTPDPT